MATFTANNIQGVFGEFVPVLDNAIGSTANNVQGIFGEFVPVLDATAGEGDSDTYFVVSVTNPDTLDLYVEGVLTVSFKKQLVDINGNLDLAGRLLGNKGVDVASATDITLGLGNYFDITGTTQIDTIAATGWTAGSVVTLQFDASVTVKHNTAGTGAVMLLAGAVDFAATVGDTLSFVFDGTAFRELARTAI